MSSRLRPKISDTERMYCACLWCPRRLTKIPTSCSSAATSSSSRSRTPRPCSLCRSSKIRTLRVATCRACDRVVLVLLPERRRRGQHLAGEVLDALALVLAHHVEQQPGPQRRLGHEHVLGLGLDQQLAVDEDRGDERLQLGEGQAVALDELLVVLGHRLLAEGQEALAGDEARGRIGRLAQQLVGDEAGVTAEGEEVAGLAQRDLAADVEHDVLDVAAEEAHSLFVAAVPGRQALAHAYGAERVGPGVDGLAAPQEGEIGAAPAYLHEQGVAHDQGLVLAQGLAHGGVGEPVLLGAVDHLDVEARAQAHAVEEGVPIDRLTHGARRHRPVAYDAVGIHDPPEAVEGPQRRLDRRRAQASPGEGVLAQQHRARGLLEDRRRLARHHLRDQQADRARAQVQDGHRAGRGLLAVSGCGRLRVGGGLVQGSRSSWRGPPF